jgi:hypothetical protein
MKNFCVEAWMTYKNVLIESDLGADTPVSHQIKSDGKLIMRIKG